MGVPITGLLKTRFILLEQLLQRLVTETLLQKLKLERFVNLTLKKFQSLTSFKMFCVVYALFGVPYFYYLMKVTGNGYIFAGG